MIQGWISVSHCQCAMFCVLVSGDATGQVFGSVRVGHGGNRDWRSSLPATAEGGEGIGHAVGEAGAHWLRAPCARGADHASPSQPCPLPPFMHISAMKACHVSPWANGACRRADLATASATRVLVPLPTVHGPWSMHQRPERTETGQDRTATDKGQARPLTPWPPLHM